jgi:hypothetical protein
MRAEGIRELSRVLVAFAVTTVVYVAAVGVSDYFDVRMPPSPIVQEAESVVAALHSYHLSRGSYPVLPDRPLLEVKKLLVEDGVSPVRFRRPCRTRQGAAVRVIWVARAMACCFISITPEANRPQSRA